MATSQLLGQISEARALSLIHSYLSRFRSKHLKAPYGLNCGSFLAHVIWRSDACHTFGLLPWIIFTGHILRSPRATRMEIPFENVLRARMVESDVKETNEEKVPARCFTGKIKRSAVWLESTSPHHPILPTLRLNSNQKRERYGMSSKAHEVLERGCQVMSFWPLVATDSSDITCLCGNLSKYEKQN